MILNLILTDDPVINSGGEGVNDCIDDGKNCNCPQRTQSKERHVGKPQYSHHFCDDAEGKGDMDARRYEREEEYGQNLRTDRAFYFRSAHPYLLHNRKTFLIFISFCYLLIVYNQDSYHKEKQTQEDTQEKKTAI